MSHYAGRAAMFSLPMLLLAGCGLGPQQHTEQVLDQRLQAQLAKNVAAGQAVIEKVPAGDRVTLLGSSMYPNGTRALDDQSLDIRADIVEALLDPALMRVQVADTSTLPDNQRNTRLRNVQNYFTANGLGPVLVPATAPAAPGPAGLAITINVVCPPPDGFIGYGSGARHPACD
jgi:hypothetical protein